MSSFVEQAPSQAPESNSKPPVGVTTVAYRLGNGSVARASYAGLGDDVLGAIEQKIKTAKASGSLMEVNSIDTVEGPEIAIDPNQICAVVIGS